MVLEAVQIVNTSLHLNDLHDHAFYQKTHASHPWCEFAATSYDHFSFVLDHAYAIGEEFERRYDKQHTSYKKMKELWSDSGNRETIRKTLGRASDEEVWSSIPQTMPDEYTCPKPVQAYRDYYRNDKMPQDWFEWDHTRPPDWIRKD